MSFSSFQEQGAGSESVDRDRPLGVLFTGFFCYAGLRPHGAVKLTGCDIKKGSKGLFSQFQTLHLPHYTMYQLTADARDVLPHLRCCKAVHASDSALPKGFH